MSSRYPMQSICENPFQGDWKQQAAFCPASRQPWIATAAALTMGRFGFLMPSAQNWRESDVELGIKRPMVSASAAAAANNLELQIICSCNRRGTDHGPFRPKLAWQRRRCHASFGRKHVASPRPLHGVLETRQRLLTATYNIGVQCWVYNVRLEPYLKKCNVRIMKCLHIFLSSLKKIQDKTVLHLQCC